MCRRIIALILTLALLAGSLAMFQYTELDVRLQDHFFDFNHGVWLVDRNAPLPRWLFYTGPKVAIIGLGATLLLAVITPRTWKPVWLNLPWPTRRIAGFLACLVLVPWLIGMLKTRSDLYCPWDLQRYGGSQPFHHLFDPVPPPGKPDCGRCFPAGHASGGFALMALVFLFDGRRARLAGLATGFFTGWAMGIYQMLKGAHFLSHTIATLLIAALIIQVIAWISTPTRPESTR